VGILDIGVMNSMAFSLLLADNSNSGENQITFGTIDF
jgi:hypothetical protein